MEVLTAVFALLFVTQTAVFIYLYRRAVTNRDITQKDKENHTPSGPQQTHETTNRSKSYDKPTLHSSAIAALRLIREKGSVTSRDVSRSLNLSREHTARVMKNLYEMGLVTRSGKPFKYNLTEKGLAIIASNSTKNHGSQTFIDIPRIAPNPASNEE
ncbi:MAG: winged helix DNA-binding protein [Candidatus Caldarchaeum sp.]